MQLINAYRFLGARIADLDPLKRHVKPVIAELDPAYYGLNEAELDTTFNTGSLVGGARMTLREIMLARFAMQAGTIVGVGSFMPSYARSDPQTGQSPNITPFWMLGGAGAEIAVDTETGRIEVTKLVNVADVGRAINPDSVARQLVGCDSLTTWREISNEGRTDTIS